MASLFTRLKQVDAFPKLHEDLQVLRALVLAVVVRVMLVMLALVLLSAASFFCCLLVLVLAIC